MIYFKKKNKLYVYNMIIYNNIFFLMYSLWKVWINGYGISSLVEVWDEDVCF